MKDYLFSVLPVTFALDQPKRKQARKFAREPTYFYEIIKKTFVDVTIISLQHNQENKEQPF